MSKTAKYWIEKLGLEKHPEGGWFKEIYRSADLVQTENGQRSAGTSIYYLLEGNDFSALHRIRSDEIWHFYTGSSSVEISWIENKQLKTVRVGVDVDSGECLQYVVPKNCWFAARLTDINGFALVGCTVSLGFDFNDFELADETLLRKFPDLIHQLAPLIRE